MDVESTCPLRVAARVWTSAHGAPLLTVACKATYVLLPGTSQLAPEQEALNEDDNYWDDDPARSLYAPSELAPYKPCADIVLVGYAFAPGRVPTTSFHVRMIVGDVDKSIEVASDRVWAADGSLQDGSRVVRMPLRYERASGGPGTWNPVGVRCAGPPDAYGRLPLPNLLPPGKTPMRRGDFVEPIGFGPIAPTWPSRMEKLGPYAGGWDSRRWHERPLPEGFDASFFNVAPRDQNVSELRDNERILLENLHPEHERLSTSLPGLRPRAVAERAGRREEIALTADSMWIDTGRGLCTLVWRGRLNLAHPREPGRITVNLDETRSPASSASVPSAASALPPMSEKPRRPLTMTIDPAETTLVRPLESSRHVMPFMMQQPVVEAPPAGAPVRPSSALAGLPFASLTAAPAPVQAAPPPMQAPPPSVPPSVQAPPPMQAPPPLQAAPPMPAPPPMQAPPPSAPPAFWPVSPAEQPAAKVSIGQRVVAESVPSSSPSSEITPEPAAPAAAVYRAPRVSPNDPYIDLLWFDKTAPKRVRAQESFAEELRDPSENGAWLTLEDTQQPKQDIKDRRDIVRALRRVRPVDADGVMRAMTEAIDDEGAFTSPLVVVSGEVQLFFHEVQTLKATIAVTSPLAGADKRLRETLDAA
ncbi:MAG TPA: DUF2169 domain-containing protein, partial [Polyangium sp.]|nr:DUF2169 domain-containing protein [Polyangium sp.]